MRTTLTLLSGTVLAAALAGPALAQTQGVTDTEIVIGTHTSLTGPVAPWGVGSTNGIRMRFEEENAKGGIYGRKIRYIVEDHGYQVPRAVQAGNKLLNSDKIFVMVAALGTPMNNAVFQSQLALNVPNVGPFTAARSMYHPFHKLKFATLSSYYVQIRAGLKYFVEREGVKAPCVMYEDNDFGQEILEGAQDQAKEMKIKIVAESSHKPTDTDFTGAITKLRDAKCDLVLMGTIVRDTIIPYSTARKLGWNVPFVGSTATYESVVAGAQGGITNGFFALSGQEVIYPDEATGPAKAFFDAYKAKYNQDPAYPAQLGYGIADAVVDVLKRAGKNLTVDGFIKALESTRDQAGPLCSPPITYSPDRHLGSEVVFLNVVENGRWKTVERGMTYEPEVADGDERTRKLRALVQSLTRRVADLERRACFNR
jgi:branched-chain amino acid transport system substrate-binding protein